MTYQPVGQLAEFTSKLKYINKQTNRIGGISNILKIQYSEKEKNVLTYTLRS